MTASARIRQSDIERVLKAVKCAGIDQARVVIDLKTQTILVDISHYEKSIDVFNEWDRELDAWDDDDV